MKTLNAFNKLVSENNGKFTFEPNEKTEIHVNVMGSEIWVEYFKNSDHINEPVRKEYFSGLYGMMGYKSVEEKFNEIVENCK